MAQTDLYDRDLAIQMKRKAYLKLVKKRAGTPRGDIW